MPQKKLKNVWLSIPIIGSVIFICLYIIAAFLYPGGSQTDKTAIGFSLTDNYWCNLLYENAINGQSNKGLPFALAAMIILCISLSVFWFVFPEQIGVSRSHRLIIQTTGIAGMACSFLLLTNIDHDLAINISSGLGFIAIAGTIIALYQSRWYKLFAFGLFNVLLIVLNNYLYYIKGMMTYLPLVQKISFISFLVWFCCICLKLLRKKHARA